MRSSRTSVGIAGSTSRRTARPKRRRRSSGLDGGEEVVGLALPRGQVSVARHPEDVVRLDLHVREEVVEVGGDQCSRGTKRNPFPTLTKRDSSGGTFTRAKRCSRLPSVTITPRFSDRLEMYGNGCPGSTASGVSTGKMSRSKAVSSSTRSASLIVGADLDAGLGQLRHDLLTVDVVDPAVGRAALSRDRFELLGRCHAVRRALVDTGGDLVLQACDADLEELVEPARPDGDELHTLEQWLVVLGKVDEVFGEIEVESSRLRNRSGAAMSLSGIVTSTFTTQTLP